VNNIIPSCSVFTNLLTTTNLTTRPPPPLSSGFSSASQHSCLDFRMQPGLITNIRASWRRVDVTVVLAQSFSRLRPRQTSQNLLSRPSTSTRINRKTCNETRLWATHTHHVLIRTADTRYLLRLEHQCKLQNSDFHTPFQICVLLQLQIIQPAKLCHLTSWFYLQCQKKF
jgi:hypothetical protein